MYEKVVSILERLVLKDPLNNDYHSAHAASLKNAGSIYENLGEGRLWSTICGILK